MVQTLVDGNQINRNWKATGGIGLAIMALVTTGYLFSGKNVAGITTFKDLPDGSHEQSGHLLIESGSSTLYADSINRKVGIRTNSPKQALEVVGTISGSALTISGNSGFSGTVALEGALTGATMNGFGLIDCSNSSTSKVLYNVSTGKFSCGTDQNTVTNYSAGQGLTLTSTAFSINSTLTGSMLRFLTVSGSTVFAKSRLSTSGSLKVLSDISGATLHINNSINDSGSLIVQGNSRIKGNESVVGTLSGAGLTIMNGNSYIFGNLDIGASANADTKLEVVGTISGAALHITGTSTFSGSLALETSLTGATLAGFGLTDCSNASTSKVLYSVATGKFSCGTDQTTAATAGQGLTLTSSSFKVNSTLTGSLNRFTTESGEVLFAHTRLTSSGGLKVLSDISGATLHVNNMASLSGALTVAGTVRGKGTINAVGALSGANLTIMGVNSYLYGSVRIGDNATPKAKLDVVGAISGSLLYAATTLRSSGSVVWEGQGSGSKLYVGNFTGSTVRVGSGGISPRILGYELFSSGSTVSTGSGKGMVTTDATMSGYKLVDAWAVVGVSGTTNSTTIQVRDIDKASRKMFTTAITIDTATNKSTKSATLPVISAANADVGGYDRLMFDIPAVSTTAPKSPLQVFLKFIKP